MTTAPETVAVSAECWCCGSTFPEADLVRLGQHPEVGICLGCAQYLYRRRAERLDHAHPSAAARARSLVRTARAEVIRRGWPDRPILGRVLRWIGRRLP